MEDRFEVELVNDSTEFDAISAATAECGNNDKYYCCPLGDDKPHCGIFDYSDGCIDYG